MRQRKLGRPLPFFHFDQVGPVGQRLETSLDAYGSILLQVGFCF